MTIQTITLIIAYFLLIDAFGAALAAFTPLKKYYRGLIARFFPLASGWVLWYVVLALYIAYLTHSFVVPLW